MSSREQDDVDDLDLLLSLQHDPDTVPESPPPSLLLTDDEQDQDEDDKKMKKKKKKGDTDMSVFRDAVKDCLLLHPHPLSLSNNNKKKSKCGVTIHHDDADVDKYSGLRINNQLLTPSQLHDSFSNIRFVRLPVIKNLMNGDSFNGSWATVGVLTEKGIPRKSSTGKTFSIWKLSCLDENTVSLFLFGDAYQRNSHEKSGTVFALFNSNLRKDTKGNGFTLSIYSPGQILKMGTSADYGVCKGRRTDGMACTVVINKRKGTYCKYHKSKASDKYSTMRTELKGGNLRTAFRPRDYLKSEGIHLVDPLADKTKLNKSKSLKLISVDGLRKALSKAGKVTTNPYSQGIRCLSAVTGKLGPTMMNKQPKIPNEQSNSNGKRKSSSVNVGSSAIKSNQHLDAKRTKPDGQVLVDKTTSTGKMIELDFVSSDEDF